MRFQSTQASCGPAALRNALLCHGVTRSEQELELLTGCTAADGTSFKGMLKALQLVAKDAPAIAPAVLSESRPDVAILRTIAALQGGHVVILCVDEWEHWVVAFGLLGMGAKVIVHVSDSADAEMVRHLKPGELLDWWKGPEAARKPYFGVIV